MRVGRSRSITGPYVDRGGVLLTRGGGTLVLSGYGRIRGPGHTSMLQEDGRDLLVHHMYDAEEDGVPKLQLRPLVRDREGWPIAGPPLDGAAPDPPVDPAPTGSWGYWRDNSYSPPTRIELLADGRVQKCDGQGSWSFAHPWLTLRWPLAAGTGTRTEVLRVSGSGRQLVGRSDDGGIVRGYRLQGS